MPDINNIKDIIEIIELAKEFKPVSEAVLEVIDLYSEDISKIYNSTLMGITEANVKSITAYRKLGLADELAVGLLLNSKEAIGKVTRTITTEVEKQLDVKTKTQKMAT